MDWFITLEDGFISDDCPTTFPSFAMVVCGTDDETEELVFETWY